MNNRKTPAAALAITVAAAIPAFAQVEGPPAFIDYQGRVLDSVGDPVADAAPENIEMYFRVWDHVSDGAMGNLVWAEKQVVTVSDGDFSVRLGEGEAITTAAGDNTVGGAASDPRPSLLDAFDGNVRYLGVSVAPNSVTKPLAEIQPRLAFLASPYAVVSQRAKVADLVTSSSGNSSLFDLTVQNRVGVGAAPSANTLTVRQGAGDDAPFLLENTAGDDLLLVGDGASTLGTDLTVNGTATVSPATGGESNGTDAATVVVDQGGASLLLDGDEIDSTAAELLINTNGTGRVTRLGDGGFFTVGGDGKAGVNHLDTEATLTVRKGGAHTRSMHVQRADGTTVLDLDDANTTFLNNRLHIAGFGLGDAEDTLTLSSPKAIRSSHVHFGPRGDWYIRSAAFNGNIVMQDGGGNVGINTANPLHLLHIEGIAFSHSQFFATPSDRRVKTAVQPVAGSLARVAELRPVTFRYTDEYREGRGRGDGTQTGFIAQEVERVFPSMVTTSKEEVGGRTIEDFRVLNTSDLLPHLVAALQDLKREKDAELEARDARIAALEKQMAAVVAHLGKNALAAMPVVAPTGGDGTR